MCGLDGAANDIEFAQWNADVGVPYLIAHQRVVEAVKVQMASYAMSLKSLADSDDEIRGSFIMRGRNVMLEPMGESEL